jgi:peroxiredoxin
VSQPGIDVTLSQLRGKNVLLAFFPRAFTKVCTQEMYSFSEAKERISVDLLIDPEGIVRWAFSDDTPSTRRENQALLAQLEAHRRSA